MIVTSGRKTRQTYCLYCNRRPGSASIEFPTVGSVLREMRVLTEGVASIFDSGYEGRLESLYYSSTTRASHLPFLAMSYHGKAVSGGFHVRLLSIIPLYTPARVPLQRCFSRGLLSAIPEKKLP